MPTRDYQNANHITAIKKNQVFVFGSNSTGFHGAGSAGQAMRGDSRNTWRDDAAFLKAKQAPKGSPDRIGKWAIYGQARGHQIGREGQSYAIETIVRPGDRRSTPLAAIQCQIVELLKFAKEHPDLEILMTPVGCGYSGYTPREMRACWEAATAQEPLPTNMKTPARLYLDEPLPSLT